MTFFEKIFGAAPKNADMQTVIEDIRKTLDNPRLETLVFAAVVREDEGVQIKCHTIADGPRGVVLLGRLAKMLPDVL